MNTRVVRLFDFAKNGSDSRPKQAASVCERMERAPAASEQSSHGAKAAVAELIAETAKSGKAQSEQAKTHTSAAKQERRHRRRVKISAPVRIRQVNINHAAEFDLTMTIDVSRDGVLFETTRHTYQRGQEVAVVFPYRPGPGDAVQEQRGQVVRVSRASEKRYGIAIAFLEGEPAYELVDSLGRPFEQGSNAAKVKTAPHQRPLVIAVEDDARTRTLLRSQLELEGYAVEAVSNPNDAVAILRHRAAVALVCEAEPFPGCMPGGGEMSGYDLCVIVRRNPKYSHMPVILTTRTGMPSDFATAHALGATVCVAKPYDLDRVANLLRMLAPVGAT